MKTIAVVLVSGVMMSLAGMALAQTSDAQYCAQLIQMYREYVGANRASGDVPMAIAKCNEGDTATGIPILEKALRDARITLPPRK